jgi:hypothetical protein
MKGNKKYMHLIPYSIRYGYFHSERNGFSFKEKLKERENVCIKFLTRYDMDISIQREMVFLSMRNGFSFKEKWLFFQREMEGKRKCMHLIRCSIRYGSFNSKRNERKEKMYALNSLLDTIWIFQFKEKWFFFQ